MTETKAEGSPLMTCRSHELFPQACTVVIFGGAGDLSTCNLIPALYNLALDGLSPTQVAVAAPAAIASSSTGFSRASLPLGAARRQIEKRAHSCNPHSRFSPKNRVSSASIPGSNGRLVCTSPTET